VRDGRDVAVSYYYHYRRAGYARPFSEFFRLFLEGHVRFGSWFDHVVDWTANRDRLNVLFIRFEDLLADLSGSIRRIAEFCEVPVREEEMGRVLRNCSFEFMREHEAKLDVRTRKCADLEPENDHFIRAGKAGGWATHLDPGMREAYSAGFDRRFGKSTAFRFVQDADHGI
jgi:hypothetical protein